MARLSLSLVLVCFSGCAAVESQGGQDPADMSFLGAGDLPFDQCGAAEYEAKVAPATMLVVLDRSASMGDDNKWNFAAQAIVQAIDQDVFDTMNLGLYAAPSGSRQGPACIFNLPVACLAPAFPQIDLRPAGTKKSGDVTGVRGQIKAWLTQNTPDNGAGDASPLYAALQAAIVALQGAGGADKRILFVVTDGTLSCNQFSTRPGFRDCNGCDHDWEHPNNIVQLLGTANRDPGQPIETFIVGVPGADTYDAQGCNYPPYRMRLALSAMAFAGSPGFVPPTCDGRTFTQAGADPARSCHIDLTRGNFSARALADTLAKVRGQVQGCVFDLPTPNGGGVIDRSLVNVRTTIEGKVSLLGKRRDPNSPCLDKGCWDYTPGGKVELVGEACEDVQAAGSYKVQISVGCATTVE